MEPTIVSIGGGGLGPDNESLLLDEYLLSLTGKDRPRVCLIPTATGDSLEAIVRFYSNFTADRCLPTHLALFNRTVEDIEALLLAQDLIYVSGGNTAAMLAIWRQHGVDKALRETWNRGIVLSGTSAGANCWYEASSTDSFGPWLSALRDGLGILQGSFCPHYDGEANRRPTLQRFVSTGELPEGYAVDNYAAIRWAGTQLAEAVSVKAGAKAYRVRRGPEGSFTEEVIEPRMLEAVTAK